MSNMEDESELVERALRGDQSAFASAFESYRPRLSRMIELRMDPRVQGRLDPSDVLQESFIQAARELPEYTNRRHVPFYLWLRLIAGQKLARAHKTHLGAAKRQAQREVSLDAPAVPDLSTINLASHLLANLTSASGAIVREEARAMVHQVLNEMDAQDREVLALRHFEDLTNREVASMLDISEAAAKSRYRRALVRITQALRQIPDLREEYPSQPEKRSNDE
ncbi:MAG TPA: RNA polymerase subunit sigma [Planctomycetaceae bacterium]|nr:RNA polymerase subunit sigma [Planctomycetaceae bacterium]